ncbi:41439ca5-de77-4b9d-94bc-f58bb9fa23c7 [Sclerotinia trifoliorum]|uniref:Cutinase n=1 Tax=Sclerotinia trifoliorum TaxID=28548 RepID=A0A8H2VN18_9HELO|nr:41439ca5-de77-4b9d-94bc-f58bb9fa23c7 [Sclerotinia trifoliorum]
MKTPQYLTLLLLPISVLATPILRGSSGNVKAAAGASACAPMMLIFARGTTETGTLGTVAGPPLVAALGQVAGGASKVAAQGVPYPADIPGFLAGGDANGSKMMAQMISTAVTNCPQSKIVMSGYSQGGQLVHNAAKMLPAATMAKVSAVVIFGDPNNGSPVAGASAAKTKVICHTGDNICAHGDLILAPHLTYGMDAGTAAAFVKTATGM